MSTSATARYDAAFFQKIQNGSLVSAREVVPVLIRLLAPRSVADVGCGTGAWLSVFREHGVTDVWGVDGGDVDRSSLEIPLERFQPADLRRPFVVGRRFDLVLSLEVGEHLPSASAESYVRQLTMLGDVVVFSAAIPNQGGEGHVNEQWPDYWKTLFEGRGFVLVDCLRRRFWDNRNVERWYRQNMMLYVEAHRLERDAALGAELEGCKDQPLALVHPATYTAPSISSLVGMARATLLRALRRRRSKS